MRNLPLRTLLLPLLALSLGFTACEEEEDLPDKHSGNGWVASRDTLSQGGVSGGWFHLQPCNGHWQLCDRPFNEVFFAMTHNSHAHQGAFSALAANQNGDLQAQLAAGVRGINIKPYRVANGNCGNGSEGIFLYHGNPVLGCIPLQGFLAKLQSFMQANPRECIAMTIEGGASMADLDSLFGITGLKPLMYHYTGGQWPALKEMVATDKRLVVMADRSDAESYPGFLRMWHHMVDVDYDRQNVSQFDCAFSRGNPDGSFFLLNHFLTALTPQPQQAAQTNAYSLLYPRALQCWAENGKRPNFVMVDFYATGDALRAVDSLNLKH